MHQKYYNVEIKFTNLAECPNGCREIEERKRERKSGREREREGGADILK